MHKDFTAKALDAFSSFPVTLQDNPLGALCMVLMTVFICLAVIAMCLGGRR